MYTQAKVMNFYLKELTVNDIEKLPFIVSDTIPIADLFNDIIKQVIYISSYEVFNYSSKEVWLKNKRLIVEDIINNKAFDDTLILIDAYISTNDYPESEYYDPHGDHTPEDEENKKPLPFDDINTLSSMLEDLNFIDFNFYINYEYKKAYIYNNDAGKLVKAYAEMLQRVKVIYGFN